MQIENKLVQEGIFEKAFQDKFVFGNDGGEEEILLLLSDCFDVD